MLSSTRLRASSAVAAAVSDLCALFLGTTMVNTKHEPIVISKEPKTHARSSQRKKYKNEYKISMNEKTSHCCAYVACCASRRPLYAPQFPV